MVRKRYRDRKGVGPSRLIPKRPSGDRYECPSDRHDRRKRANLANRTVLEEFCQEHGIALAIRNDGHHWLFRRKKILVEWWPSSAKLVVNKRWKQGIHIHDWEQARAQLCTAFSIKEKQHE